jgi:hydroxypyruvate reductase
MSEIADPRAFLRSLFDAALDAARPALIVPPHLPNPPKGRTVVVGAGKAAASMAEAVEAHWPADKPLSGLVVTRYAHGGNTKRIEVVEAGHPMPDANGYAAAGRIIEMVKGLTADDLVLCLVSGGGSALLTAPPTEVPLAAKQAVTKALLLGGAAIGEINCVRKHLSAIKGGRLALAAAPARVKTLIISDVPGDDPATVASGPTIPDPTTRQDALAVLAKYNLVVPPSVTRWLNNPASETAKPGDPAFAHVENVVIATAQTALDAAAKAARKAGVTPLVLGNAIEGESREIAKMHAGMARQVAMHGQPAPAPCVLISGGETTVTVQGKGRGGRDAEFLLALAIALGGQDETWALACDTDGIDGTEDNAGAIMASDTLARARAMGLKAADYLANNDAYNFFKALDDLIVTGPTRTNVNDFRAIYVRKSLPE